MSDLEPSQSSPFTDILEPYHDHSCHSRQRWIKGMTEPFPCDCSIREAERAIKAALKKIIDDAEREVPAIDVTSVIKAKLGINDD